MRPLSGVRLPVGVGLGLLLALALPPAHASAADDLSSALNRARRLAARGQASVTVNFPPRDPPTRQVGQLPAVPFRPAMIARNFNVVSSGNEILASRQTTRFELTPKFSGAARWTLWVDQVWNIPLAFEEHSADGSLARRAAFQSVAAAPAQVNRPVPAVPPGLRAALLAALPGLKLPPGFMPVSVKQSGQRWEISLSDGANMLALVTAPRNVQAAPGVASRQVGRRYIWLVGNLPEDALRAALVGVQQINEAGLGTFLPAASSNP